MKREDIERVRERRYREGEKEKREYKESVRDRRYIERGRERIWREGE